jgi:putative ABC transport system permease protein
MISKTSGWKAKIQLGLRELFHKKQSERDLDSEVRFHLEQQVAAKRAAGMNEQEARETSMREFGSVALAEEECRDARGTRWIENIFQDLRFAVRTLLKKPGFTAVAVITLALGIGANTAIFSVVNAVLLQPLRFRDPASLVLVNEGIPKIGFPSVGFSPPDLISYQRLQKSFEGVAGFEHQHYSLSGHGEPKRIEGSRVSANLFSVLGSEPAIGRAFRPEEDAPGQHVVMLSYGLWQRQYGGSQTILGQTIDLDRVPYTVVGVMPRGFAFPVPGTPDESEPAELWVPLAFTPGEQTAYGNFFNTAVVARLKPGVSIEEAKAEGVVLSSRLLQDYPQAVLKLFPNLSLVFPMAPLGRVVVGEVRPMLLVLQVAVGLVLLIACANVALLLLARASGRSREIAIRTALGATRGRLVLQLLTESFVLAISGAVVGLWLASWLKAAFLAFIPASVPLPKTVPMDSGVMLFTLAVATLASLVFGVVPALSATRTDLRGSLQEGGRGATVGRAKNRLQNVFVVAEFALALVLLAGAGLLLRSFQKLLRTDPGFRPANLLAMQVPLPGPSYPTADDVRVFYQRAFNQIAQVPGVISAGFSNDLPLNGNELDAIAIEGRETASMPSVRQSWIVGDYLQTLGVPLIRGREFNTDDRPNTMPVVLISEGMARTLWPGENPIGKRIQFNGVWKTIVGIVGDVHDEELSRTPTPHTYTPFLQESDKITGDTVNGSLRSLRLVVRTQGDPSAMTPAIVGALHNLDASLAIAGIRTLDADISTSTAPQRFNAALIGIYAVAALLLALVGIYGVLAYTVTQRMHEFGIRLALGAQRGNILALVLRRGVKLVVLGAAIGLACALALTQFMASMLYGIAPRDPVTFASVTLLLAGAAVLACYIPARRATRVDPIIALRYE